MTSVILSLGFLGSLAMAEFSDWCGDAATYHVKIGPRAWDVRVGDAGRICDDNVPVNLRPVTRFSASGGLTGLGSYYTFFGGRVRMVLRHVKLRCSPRRDCQPLRAGERCGILRAEQNVWPGAEAAFKAAPADPKSRVQFDRVAWNALLGVAAARDMLTERQPWAAFGLTEEERDALGEDLAYSRRHCDDVEADPRGGVASAGRLGVIEGERIVPLGELYDGRWQVSETTFHSLYRRYDAAAREIWALRTAETVPLALHWQAIDRLGAKPTSLDLKIPFLITQDETVERRGFFLDLHPTENLRVISSLGGDKDPERWRAERPTRALIKRARDAFRQDHARRFECLPRGDEVDGEQLREVAEPFADAELDVYRAFTSKSGDALVGVKVANGCRQIVVSETSLPPVLQRHWYFLPRGTAPARLVTRAKEAWLALDFDQDQTSEWIFSSVGVDERPPYYYALFARPRGEVVESH